jgi:hypothetical protein
LEADQLIGAELKPKISDRKKLRGLRTLRKNAYERRTHSLAILWLYPLHFEKDRGRSPSGNAGRAVMQKSTKSRGSARHSQIWFLVLQNPRYEAVLPTSDLLAESLPEEWWSNGSAVEKYSINAGAIVQKLGKVSGYRTVGRIR